MDKNEKELTDRVKTNCDAIKSTLHNLGVRQLTELTFLLDWLQKRYPHAPGSSGNHQCWPGGYYDHIADCLMWAIILHPVINPPCSIQDVAYVIFLHDLEKPVKYCERHLMEDMTDQEARENMMHNFNIYPTEEQKLALKYIHGEGEDYRKDKRVMSELAAFCHIVDTLSARVFHSNKNN